MLNGFSVKNNPSKYEKLKMFAVIQENNELEKWLKLTTKIAMNTLSSKY